jgi:hypothetical protein
LLYVTISLSLYNVLIEYIQYNYCRSP